MRDEKWIKDQLKELAKTCAEHARENRKQAKENEVRDRHHAAWLEGGAESMEYAAKEVKRILSGKTSVEAMIELVKKSQNMRKATV
jgi:hypothetical protein